MEKKVLIITACCLLVLLFSCSVDKKESKKREVTLAPAAAPPKTASWSKKMDGYWLLSNYFDGVLETKSIDKYRRMRMFKQAIILKVENDSLIHIGSLGGSYHKKIPLIHNYDSLAILERAYVLQYDSTQDKIFIHEKQIEGRSNEGIDYSFRRLKEKESRLIEGIKELHEEQWPDFSSNITSFLVDSLLLGAYVPIGNNKMSDTLFLQKKRGKKYGLKGFKGYNSFYMENGFGTHHPYRPHNGISFDDTLSHEFEIFSWEWIRDELVFVKMVPGGHENYVQDRRFIYRYKRAK
ncbi:hypothetical protein [Saprospira grandis]|uniref:hypothetical protein n=1 Tax=Saprospira grandis TaxID=1008 RepID=UPI0022DDEBF7|nr:hypothetical protein [Saprospira grandis]WBM75765.1 hypothetical protein OP864_05875 [Saprospira grandis]